MSTNFLGCPGLNYRSEYESGRASTKATVFLLRQAVEKRMLAAGDNRPDVRTAVHAGHENHSNVRVVADVDQTDDLLKRIRRDPDQYRDK